MHGTTPNDVHGKKRRMDWDPLDLNSNADIGSSDPKTPNLACGKERRKNGSGSKYLAQFDIELAREFILCFERDYNGCDK